MDLQCNRLVSWKISTLNSRQNLMVISFFPVLHFDSDVREKCCNYCMSHTKTSICGQILLNLTQFITLQTESNLEGFVWSHWSLTGLISETMCPEMLVFGK